MVSLLMVCTGNICRSAFAERWLQKQLDEVSPGSFRIQSAGIQALEGHSMDSAAASRLAGRGGSDLGFSARQLREETLTGASFVLAMAEEHRRAVVAMSPKMLKRTYLITEFAAVLDDLVARPPSELPYGKKSVERKARWDMLRTLVMLNRHDTRSRLQGALDIKDPYLRGELAFDNMVAALDPLLASIARFESLGMSRAPQQ